MMAKSSYGKQGILGRISVTGFVTALMLSNAAGAARAQQAGAQVTPDLKPNPLVALQRFEAPANQDYTLGRGDEISIDFGGRPELNGKRIVGPDGRITIAPAGSIEVADKTRDEAAVAIAAAMSTYYSHLTVTVGVDRYTSNKVLLLGAVEHPGVITFDKPPTLLEVITQAGGLARANSTLSHGAYAGVAPGASVGPAAVPERCAIYRGSEEVLWVDLKGLLDHGSPLAALRLKRDDVVYVPSPSERYVSVLGQVQHPGALQLDNDSTLPKLLAEAGGLTVQAGKSPNIQVIQTSTGTTRVIPFKSLLQPGSTDLTLKSGDVIFVPESGFNQVSYVFQQLSPLLSLFTTAALINR